MSRDNLRAFTESIMQLQATSINVFGRGLPGNIGHSAAVQGAAHPAADMIFSLKKTTAAFFKATNTGDQNKINTLAGDIEAQLLGLQAVGALTEDDLNRLLDDLHKLVEDKE